MKQVDVLIVVDALGAVSSDRLQDNVYLIDTNKYMGSWDEGQCELSTACQDGQIIKWRVASVNPGNDVSIVQFTGDIINKGICDPKQQGISEDVFWEGIVEAREQPGSYQYSVVLDIDGKSMTFDPFLVLKK